MSPSPHGGRSSAAVPADMPRLVQDVVRRIPDRTLRDADFELVYRDAHSNDVAEVHFGDRQVLHVKRARGPDAADRCATSRMASRLLRERAGLLAPAHLPVDLPSEDPIVVYWRLWEPTLNEVVASFPSGRPEIATLESLGRLIAQIQTLEFPGHGPLSGPHATLAEFLQDDVGGRLRPAVHGEWPEGAAPLENLLDVVGRWVHDDGSPAVLTHNDLHAENVLCRRQGDAHRCVGVLDLEDAFAGPAEADLAKLEVLHGPLFGRPWETSWLEAVRRGYARSVIPFRLGVLRVYHLLNLGFYAAHIGFDDRAQRVAEATTRELAALGEARPHAQIVADLAPGY